MTWPEPLTTRAIRTSDFTVTLHCLDAGGRAVAGVFCAINERSRCGAFGEIAVASGGGPRQVRRAMVLLARAALAYGQERGILVVETLVLPNVRSFVADLTGYDTERMASQDGELRVPLADVYDRILNRSRDDGEITADGR